MADIPEFPFASGVRSGGKKGPQLKVDEPYLHPHPKTQGLYFRRTFAERLRPFLPGKLTELKVSLGSKSVLALGVSEKFREAAREYDALYTRAVKLKDGAFDELAPHYVV